MAFFTGKKLKKVSVSGGAPLTVCDATWALGGTWGTDGTIIFGPEETGGLWGVSAAGGIAEQVTKPESTSKNAAHAWPQFLQGGNSVIYTNHDGSVSNYDEAIIEVFSLDTNSTNALSTLWL